MAIHQEEKLDVAAAVAAAGNDSRTSSQGGEEGTAGVSQSELPAENCSLSSFESTRRGGGRNKSYLMSLNSSLLPLAFRSKLLLALLFAAAV